MVAQRVNKEKLALLDGLICCLIFPGVVLAVIFGPVEPAPCMPPALHIQHYMIRERCTYSTKVYVTLHNK